MKDLVYLEHDGVVRCAHPNRHQHAGCPSPFVGTMAPYQLPWNQYCSTRIAPMPEQSVYDDTYTGEWNANTLFVVICSALAGYNALELLLLIFTTFNIYRGLYFWSLLVASSGIVAYLVGLNIVYFVISTNVIGWILCGIGWVCMVTGQSVVLYSRLGVVLGKGYDRLLFFVKWMIIVNGFVLHSVTTVFTFGTHFAKDPTVFQNGYFYVEKIQMTGFCTQEFIISGIYIWKAIDLIRSGERKHTHRIMAQLFVINLIIVILDIGLLSLEYKNLFIAEISFKELTYSIKLKLEFAILSKLVEFTGPRKRRFSAMFGDTRGILDESVRSASFATVQRVDTALTVRSDARPQWMYDVEKMDTIPVAPNEKLVAFSSDIAPVDLSANDHNFDSISPPSRTRTRCECDLMYADAMRIVSKH